MLSFVYSRNPGTSWFKLGCRWMAGNRQKELLLFYRQAILAGWQYVNWCQNIQ